MSSNSRLRNRFSAGIAAAAILVAMALRGAEATLL